jgi:hypothetical protein
LSDAGERSWLRTFGSGYGPFVSVTLAVFAVAAALAFQNALANAPALVTEDDIAQLRSQPAVPGSAEASPATAFTRRRSGGFCSRDHALLSFGQFVRLPKSQLLRLEYTLVTDCRLRPFG